MLNVHCRLRTGDGRRRGFGSMTLGNAWAFPAASHDVGLGAMKALADACARVTGACDDHGHALDLWRALEPAFARPAGAVAAS